MAQGTGDALEWALALAKAPSERIELRQRSLPDGMQQLLQVAGDGAADTVAAVAAQTGEDPADIVEAARFYAREILFFHATDAYRVLGVSPHEDQETLRSHHRLLQQWLHPDRHTSDWDAIFSSRVNAAWNLLRTPERRLAYDSENPQRPLQPSGAVPSAPMLLRTEMIPPYLPGPWQRRAPFLVLAAACAALAALAVRDMQQEPENRFAGQSIAAVEERPDAMPSLKAPLILPPPQSRKSRAAAPPMPRMVAPISLPDPLPEVVQTASQNQSAAVATRLQANAEKAAESTSKTPRNVAVAPPSTAPASAAPAPRISPSTAPPIAVRTPASARTSRALTPAVERAPPTVAAAVPMPVARQAPADDGSAAISAQRAQQAQQVGDRLIAFISATGAKSPPIWSSTVAQSGAAELRDDLHGKGELKISGVHWRVGEKVAVLQADLRYADGNKGRLSADLIWREQRWLVTGLSAERDL